jgi:ATP-dependent DNA helicase DinG
MKFTEEVHNMFLPGGGLSKALPGFESRDPQVQMALLVAKCIEERKHGILQAGVGTGKSLAYALPAALYAVKNNKRVIISTNTKDLQRQLVHNDLPMIRTILESEGHTLTYGEAKGQSNYLCKRKLYELKDNGRFPEYIDSLIENVENTDLIGDRNSFTDDLPYHVWNEVVANSSDCMNKQSPYYDSCFFQRARQHIHHGHIIVSNHAMFFTDLSKREQGFPGVFPEYDFVIFDEAHRIEEVYSNFWEMDLSLKKLEDAFRPIQTRKYKWMKNIIKDKVYNDLLEFRRMILDKASSFFMKIDGLFQSSGLETLILEQAVLKYNPFDDLFGEMIKYLKVLPFIIQVTEEESKGISNMIKKFSSLNDQMWSIICMEYDYEWAYWIERNDQEVNPSRRIIMKCSPYAPRTALKTLNEKSKVIYTSGTIAPKGDFNYPAQRYGLKDYHTLDVQSPFDYYNQSLLVIPEDIPIDQRDQDLYYETIAEKLKDIFMITRGSTFVLFTSNEAIRETEKRIKTWVEEQHLDLYVQQPGVNREKLLGDFVRSDRGILFGAESFWEGINVPGKDLKCVVIVKLPFPNPSDPLTKAKMKRIDMDGQNSFYDFSLKITQIKMNQGFGRLIRSQSDEGAVIILDSRLLKKRYGDTILRSLPNAKRSNDINEIKRFFKR